MKKILFCCLALLATHLDATHFQSSMSVTPTGNDNEFLVEMQINKVLDNSTTELVASPKMVCMRGEPAQLKIESEDKADSLVIEVLIPENVSTDCVKASIFMKEKDQVVLACDHNIKLI